MMIDIDSQEKFCVSIVDPSRPSWYVRHFNFLLSVENASRPRNPQLFDGDASFFLIPDKFYPGYYAFDSVNVPDHYILATAYGGTRLEKLRHGRSYRDRVSFVLTDYIVGRKIVYTSLKFNVLYRLSVTGSRSPGISCRQ